MELSETIRLERKEIEGIISPGALFLLNETRGCIIHWTQKEHWWSWGASLQNKIYDTPGLCDTHRLHFPFGT